MLIRLNTMPDYEADLNALRQAAQARDPEQTQFLLKKLFMQMEFYYAVAVVVERLHPFVEIFEGYYPEAHFARQVLTQVASTGTPPRRLPPEAMQDFTAPGAANFMKALSDLAHGLQQGALPPRIGHLVSAVVHAIMAELVEHWYGQRLNLWEQVQADPTQPDAQKIAYEFWMDEDVALLDTDAWLLVADSIEAKLKRQ